MYVVNDGAERGVRLCHDFISQARREDRHQQILQVVENNRNQQPNQRSRKTDTKRWYLKLWNEMDIHSKNFMFSMYISMVLFFLLLSLWWIINDVWNGVSKGLELFSVFMLTLTDVSVHSPLSTLFCQDFELSSKNGQLAAQGKSPSNGLKLFFWLYFMIWHGEKMVQLEWTIF